MKLYTFFRSSAAFRVRIALNYKGLEYEPAGVSLAKGFTMLETFLVREQRHGKYCFRDQVTMADCCLVPQVFNARRYDCDLSPYPTVVRLHEACMKLDAFIRAQPSQQPDAV